MGTPSGASVRVRVLAETSVMVALAVVLDSLRFFTLPQGGSITAGEMVPIFLLALRRGPRVGVMGGAVLGVIDLYFEPVIYSPVQFLLDYPIAYGALGLSGIFMQRGVKLSGVGVALGVGCRFVSHFFSGIIFFSSFAPAGESPALYSALYNASYLLPGLVISEFFVLLLVGAGALKFRL